MNKNSCLGSYKTGIFIHFFTREKNRFAKMRKRKIFFNNQNLNGLFKIFPAPSFFSKEIIFLKQKTE